MVKLSVVLTDGLKTTHYTEGNIMDAQSNPQPAQQPQPTPSPQTAAPATGNGRKILCAEDEHFIGELYSRALSKAGYQPTWVVDGAEALAKARSDEFDIILLDLMMPSMTGMEVLAALRDPSKSQPIRAKIVIATNLDQRADIRAKIESQADGYIIKADLTPSELVGILDTIT